MMTHPPVAKYCSVTESPALVNVTVANPFAVVGVRTPVPSAACETCAMVMICPSVPLAKVSAFPAAVLVNAVLDAVIEIAPDPLRAAGVKMVAPVCVVAPVTASVPLIVSDPVSATVAAALRVK